MTHVEIAWTHFIIIFFSQKSLSFFVDINGAESPGPPPLTRFLFFHFVILDIATARFLSWTLQFPIKRQFDWNQVASNITIFDLPIFRIMLFIALGYHFWGTWQSPSQSRLNPNSIYFLIEDNSSCLFFGIAPIPFIWLLFLALLSSSIQSILIFGINCCEELFSTAVTLVVITVQGVPIHPFVNQPPFRWDADQPIPIAF